jgi:hypothetical protein
MKTSIKTFACALAISALFSSCLNSDDDEQGNILNNSNTGSLLSSSSEDSDSSWTSPNDRICGEKTIAGWEGSAMDSVCVRITEIPAMDERVAAYKKIDSTNMLYKELHGSVHSIIKSKESLKLFFPNINDEQADKCVAISVRATNFEYYVLSYSINMKNALSFYQILPGNREECILDGEPEFHITLVCDDTGELRENTINPPDLINPSLFERVYLYDTKSYNDPGWDCKTETAKDRGVFFGF